MPDLIGRNLVDGNARMDVRAGGFLDADAGQERAAGARVVASAVRPRADPTPSVTATCAGSGRTISSGWWPTGVGLERGVDPLLLVLTGVLGH